MTDYYLLDEQGEPAQPSLTGRKSPQVRGLVSTCMTEGRELAAHIVEEWGM